MGAAEPGGESFDLAAGAFQGSRAVDFFGGEAQFFFDRKLRGDAAAGFGFAEAACAEALKLLLGFAPSDHQALECLVNASFDDEGRFDKSNIARALTLPFLELTRDDFRDPRVDDGVQAVELGAIAKNDGGKFGAVDAAAGVGDGRPEFLKNFVIGRLAGLYELVGEGVGIEDGEAQVAEHGGDGAFAAGDASGESESEHDRGLPSAGDGLRGGKSGGGAAEARSLHGVAHEHGDGHGADAAGNRGERACEVDSIRMNVADQGVSFGAEFFEALGEIAEETLCFLGLGDAIRAYINDRGAGLDPAGLDETGLAHGGDNDVSAADHFGEVARFRMANRDGGVGVHEEKGHGLADDVAAAEDDGVCAFDGNVVAAKDFHAAGGSAGDQAGAPADEAAEIHGMEAVHVFEGIDGFEDALGVHLRRKRELDEDAVDVVVAVQVFDNGEEIERVYRGGRREKGAGQAELFAGGDFAFHVELRRGVFANEDGGETGADARGCEQADFVFQFGEDLVADFGAVEDACGHAMVAFYTEFG